MSRLPPDGVDARAAAGLAGRWAPAGAAELDALPYPVLLIERGGAGAVRFANAAARAAGLAPQPAVPGGDGRFTADHYLTDEQGRRLSAGDTPTARAARGEEFSTLHVAWHGPAGRTAFLAFARRVAPPTDDGDGRATKPDLVAVSFIDVPAAEAVEAELRESLSARDEFVSVATHELKEPLASILLSLQLLEMIAGGGSSVPADEVLSTVGVLRRQGDRLARLIENLLDVSRINNNRMRLDLEALDVCDLVRDCVEHFRQAAARAGCTLTFDDACPSCIGYFDRLRLEQVVSNLLSNAIK